MRNLELLSALVLKELRVRYKGSVLGYIWAVTNPFAFALVYYIAFKIIMRVNMENYTVFLLSGMFPWMWLSNALHASTNCFRNNASLIKYVSLPRYILPLSNVAHETIHFLFTLPVLAIFIVFSGGELFFSWIWQVPILIVLQFVFLYPFALILALANVLVHDVEYLVGISLSMLFFLTPIVYPIDLVPESFQFYLDMSPLSSLIQLWHGVTLRGVLSFSDLLLPLAVALGMGVLASIWYARVSRKIGELL